MPAMTKIFCLIAASAQAWFHLVTPLTSRPGSDLSCYNWSPPKLVPPGPFMAAIAGPPGPFAALQMVPRANYGTMVGPSLPQLASCIFQHLLLFH